MLVRTRTSLCVARLGEEVNSERGRSGLIFVRFKYPQMSESRKAGSPKALIALSLHLIRKDPSTRLRTCFSTGRPRVSQKIDKEIPAAERLRYQCFEIAGALRSSNHPPFVAAGSSRLNHSDMQCSPLRIQTLPRSSDLLLGKDNSSLARRVKNSRSHN